jgi:hypothetical protein
MWTRIVRSWTLLQPAVCRDGSNTHTLHRLGARHLAEELPRGVTWAHRRRRALGRLVERQHVRTHAAHDLSGCSVRVGGLPVEGPRSK